MDSPVWKIEGLEVCDVADFKNCVIRIFFSVKNSQKSFNGDHIIFKSDDGFIQFEQLTEDVVMAWLKNSLGHQKVLKIESRLSSMDVLDIFTNKVAQPVVVNLPWAKE